MSEKHFTEIDICRGIGIILVVLGHALKQTGAQNTVFDAVLSVIYSFHMPLFFFLSGFVSIKILKFLSWEDRFRYIKGRAFRLLIPYFTIGILYMPLKYFLSRYALKPYDFSQVWRILIGENPNTALWFLYTLFWVSVLCTLLLRRKNLNLALALSLILMVTAAGRGWTVRLPQYLFFFVWGVHMRENYEKRRGLLEERMVFLVYLMIFAVMNYFMLKGVNLRFSQVVNPMLASITGIYCCMFLGIRISKNGGWLFRSLDKLGKYSMDIYILSEPFNTVAKLLCWNLLGWNYLACTGVCFLGAMLLPVPVSEYIVRRVKLFRILVLGIH